MEQNKEAFTKEGIKVALAYFKKAIDAKLSDHLARLRHDQGEKKMRPRLRKTFPRFPFVYFGNFGKTSNQTWTNFSSE